MFVHRRPQTIRVKRGKFAFVSFLSETVSDIGIFSILDSF